MIAAMLFFATKTLNMSYHEALWDVPAAFIFLMRYQYYFEERNGQLMTLGDKEFIDSLDHK